MARKPALESARRSARSVVKAATPEPLPMPIGENTARKLRAIHDHLNLLNSERREHILALMAGILGGHHVMFVGLPGTGKTKLSRHAAQLLGCRFNSKCLSSGSRIDSIIGPLDIAAYNQGLHKRVLAHGVCGTEVVFFDEFFRPSMDELLTLLPVLEEREYDNGEGMEPIPLRSLIAATNSIPDLDRVGALWRRLPIKLSVESLSDEGRDSFLQQLCSDSSVISKEPESLTPEEVAEIADAIKTSRANLPTATPYWLSAVCSEVKAAGAWKQQTPESLAVCLADVFATALTINRITLATGENAVETDIVQSSAASAIDWVLFLPGERERPSHAFGQTTAIFTELHQVQQNLTTTFMQVAPGLAASVATVSLHLEELLEGGEVLYYAGGADNSCLRAIETCLQELRSPTVCGMTAVAETMASTFVGRRDNTRDSIEAIHAALRSLSAWVAQVDTATSGGPFSRVGLSSAINNDRPLSLLEKAMNVCSNEYIPF